MADSEHHRGLSLMPFRVPLPNPLAWIPRPRFGRKNKRNFASTSVSISESVLGASSSTATLPAAPKGAALKPASDVLAGALARAASQSTIHPLDTFKVRMQTSAGKPKAPVIVAGGLSKFGQLVPPTPGPPAPFDLQTLGKNVASLYRGVVGAASGAGIAIGAYFAVYGAACNMLSRHTDLSPTAVAFVSGGLAAAGSSVVKVPLAVCIRSVQAGVYPNFFAAAKSIMAAAGVGGLFTGFLPTLLEDVPDM